MFNTQWLVLLKYVILHWWHLSRCTTGNDTLFPSGSVGTLKHGQSAEVLSVFFYTAAAVLNSNRPNWNLSYSGFIGIWSQGRALGLFVVLFKKVKTKWISFCSSFYTCNSEVCEAVSTGTCRRCGSKGWSPCPSPKCFTCARLNVWSLFGVLLFLSYWCHNNVRSQVFQQDVGSLNMFAEVISC